MLLSDNGRFVNERKISYHQAGSINTQLGDPFPYLGSNIASTEADIEAQISKAWCACNGLNVIWKSTLPDDFLHAAVESVLLYGSIWTLNKKLEGKCFKQF